MTCHNICNALKNGWALRTTTLRMSRNYYESVFYKRWSMKYKGNKRYNAPHSCDFSRIWFLWDVDNRSCQSNRLQMKGTDQRSLKTNTNDCFLAKQYIYHYSFIKICYPKSKLLLHTFLEISWLLLTKLPSMAGLLPSYDVALIGSVTCRFCSQNSH